MTPEFREIALDSLYISPLNVRRDWGDLAELTESVTDLGVVEPILVVQRGERYEVVAGSRRAEAARRAGLPTIPALVLEVTDPQAIRISLIENVHRKEINLGERVEAYKALQDLDPTLRTNRALASATGLSHQKISQDFQAYELHLKLAPFGIRVASDLPSTSAERQQGEVLPEYHAVLLHQALPYIADESETDEKLAELAKTIAPVSQAEAKAHIAALKSEWEEAEDSEDSPPGWRIKPVLSSSFEHSIPPARLRTEGGVVFCSHCGQPLSIVHAGKGTHQVKRHVTDHPQNQLELPGLSP